MDKKLIESIQKDNLTQIMEYIDEYYSEHGETVDGDLLNALEQWFGEPLGTGSSRIVYEIDDKMCLKCCLNKKGVVQNEKEYDIFSHLNGNRETNLFTKIYYRSQNFYWLICENVLQLEDADFTQIFGFGNTTNVDYEYVKNGQKVVDTVDYSKYMKNGINNNITFYSFIEWCYDEAKGINNQKINGKLEQIEQLNSEIETLKANNDDWLFAIESANKRRIEEYKQEIDNINTERKYFFEKMKKFQTLREIYDFIVMGNGLAFDVAKNNLGLTIRNGKPSIVLLDYGLTDDLYNKYYKNNGS